MIARLYLINLFDVASRLQQSGREQESRESRGVQAAQLGQLLPKGLFRRQVRCRQPHFHHVYIQANGGRLRPASIVILSREPARGSPYSEGPAGGAPDDLPAGSTSYSDQRESSTMTVCAVLLSRSTRARCLIFYSFSVYVNNVL